MFVSVINLSIQLSLLNANDGGAFGNWSQENHYNLPSYIYTMDQINDPIATMYNSSVLYLPPGINVSDHKFQFGNDRIVVIASNYGYIQLRADESGPKYLNDFNRNQNQFGGGIGYLTNSTNNDQLLLSTFFTENNVNNVNNPYREYSFYFRRYMAINNLITINQTLMAPFGDDPVIISEIVLQSNIDAQNLNYFEVYGS
eukprot:162141_1